MKFTLLPFLFATAHAAVQGVDISHYQSSFNFAAAYGAGIRFAYIKATEGTTYQDPKFSQHYGGATNAGFIRGGYHFARPAASSGAAQANFFVAHGGGWSGDGITLPGMLDLEGDCAGLSQSGMVSWIASFSNQYHAATSRWPVIYTTASWWSTCTGNSGAFSGNSPLMLARWASSAGTIPGGWPFYTIWQYKDSNAYGGDSDVFNGELANLKKLATG